MASNRKEGHSQLLNSIRISLVSTNLGQLHQPKIKSTDFIAIQGIIIIIFPSALLRELGSLC